MTPAAPTIVHRLRALARSAPDTVLFSFLTDGEAASVDLTAAALHERAAGVAAGLIARGLEGRPVALLVRPGLDYVTALMGCLYARAIAVPAFPARKGPDLARIQGIIAAAGATLAIADAEYRDKPPAFPNAPDLTLRTLSDLAGGRGLAEAAEPLASDVALVQYTSGSTQKPRGVVVTHGNISANLHAMHAAVGLWAWTGICWLPPYHDLGLMAGLLLTIERGGFTVLLSPLHFVQRPVRWLRAISRYRAHGTAGPDFAYRFCVDRVTEAESRDLDLSSLVATFTGAEPVREETLSAFARRFEGNGFSRASLLPCYGLAESTLIVTTRRPGEAPAALTPDLAALERGLYRPAAAAGGRRLVSCGSVISGHRVTIVNASHEALGEDQIGEIRVQGPSVSPGYWNDPEATAEIFEPVEDAAGGRRVRTGDLGFLHESELYVTGRIKNLIIVRGRNLYAEEVEDVAGGAHPAFRVGAVAAFPLEDGAAEQLALLLEVRRTQRHVPPDELLRSAREAVTRVFGIAPAYLGLVAEGHLPRTPSGKLQRVLCRHMVREGQLSEIARSAP